MASKEPKTIGKFPRRFFSSLRRVKKSGRGYKNGLQGTEHNTSGFTAYDLQNTQNDNAIIDFEATIPLDSPCKSDADTSTAQASTPDAAAAVLSPLAVSFRAINADVSIMENVVPDMPGNLVSPNHVRRVELGGPMSASADSGIDCSILLSEKNSPEQFVAFSRREAERLRQEQLLHESMLEPLTEVDSRSSSETSVSLNENLDGVDNEALNDTEDGGSDNQLLGAVGGIATDSEVFERGVCENHNYNESLLDNEHGSDVQEPIIHMPIPCLPSTGHHGDYVTLSPTPCSTRVTGNLTDQSDYVTLSQNDSNLCLGEVSSNSLPVASTATVSSISRTIHSNPTIQPVTSSSSSHRNHLHGVSILDSPSNKTDETKTVEARLRQENVSLSSIQMSIGHEIVNPIPVTSSSTSVSVRALQPTTTVTVPIASPVKVVSNENSAFAKCKQITRSVSDAGKGFLGRFRHKSKDSVLTCNDSVFEETFSKQSSKLSKVKSSMRKSKKGESKKTKEKIKGKARHASEPVDSLSQTSLKYKSMLSENNAKLESHRKEKQSPVVKEILTEKPPKGVPISLNHRKSPVIKDVLSESDQNKLNESIKMRQSPTGRDSVMQESLIQDFTDSICRMTSALHASSAESIACICDCKNKHANMEGRDKRKTPSPCSIHSCTSDRNIHCSSEATSDIASPTNSQSYQGNETRPVLNEYCNSPGNVEPSNLESENNETYLNNQLETSRRSTKNQQQQFEISISGKYCTLCDGNEMGLKCQCASSCDSDSTCDSGDDDLDCSNFCIASPQTGKLTLLSDDDTYSSECDTASIKSFCSSSDSSSETESGQSWGASAKSLNLNASAHSLNKLHLEGGVLDTSSRNAHHRSKVNGGEDRRRSSRDVGETLNLSKSYDRDQVKKYSSRTKLNNSSSRRNNSISVNKSQSNRSGDKISDRTGVASDRTGEMNSSNSSRGSTRSFKCRTMPKDCSSPVESRQPRNDINDDSFNLDTSEYSVKFKEVDFENGEVMYMENSFTDDCKDFWGTEAQRSHRGEGQSQRSNNDIEVQGPVSRSDQFTERSSFCATPVSSPRVVTGQSKDFDSEFKFPTNLPPKSISNKIRNSDRSRSRHGLDPRNSSVNRSLSKHEIDAVYDEAQGHCQTFDSPGLENNVGSPETCESRLQEVDQDSSFTTQESSFTTRDSSFSNRDSSFTDVSFEGSFAESSFSVRSHNNKLVNNFCMNTSHNNVNQHEISINESSYIDFNSSIRSSRPNSHSVLPGDISAALVKRKPPNHGMPPPRSRNHRASYNADRDSLNLSSLPKFSTSFSNLNDSCMLRKGTNSPRSRLQRSHSAMYSPNQSFSRNSALYSSFHEGSSSPCPSPLDLSMNKPRNERSTGSSGASRRHSSTTALNQSMPEKSSKWMDSHVGQVFSPAKRVLQKNRGLSESDLCKEILNLYVSDADESGFGVIDVDASFNTSTVSEADGSLRGTVEDGSLDDSHLQYGTYVAPRRVERETNVDDFKTTTVWSCYSGEARTRRLPGGNGSFVVEEDDLQPLPAREQRAPVTHQQQQRSRHRPSSSTERTRSSSADRSRRRKHRAKLSASLNLSSLNSSHSDWDTDSVLNESSCVDAVDGSREERRPVVGRLALRDKTNVSRRLSALKLPDTKREPVNKDSLLGEIQEQKTSDPPKMGEQTFDRLTLLHTAHNGQRRVRCLTMDESQSVMKTYPPPKEASRVSWGQTISEMDLYRHTPRKTPVKTRPILNQKENNNISGEIDSPSPIVLTKMRKPKSLAKRYKNWPWS